MLEFAVTFLSSAQMALKHSIGGSNIKAVKHKTMGLFIYKQVLSFPKQVFLPCYLFFPMCSKLFVCSHKSQMTNTLEDWPHLLASGKVTEDNYLQVQLGALAKYTCQNNKYIVWGQIKPQCSVLPFR